MCIFGDILYVLLRDKEDNGSLISFNIEIDGTLNNQSGEMPTMGKVACHLCCDEGNIYVANYISGNIIKMLDNVVMHRGSSIHETRQTSPHPHYICPTPDKKYIVSADLGLDEIIVYDKNLNFVSKTSVPKGHGVRHIAFTDDGKTAFSANELGSTVSVFDYNDGRFTLKSTVNTLFNKREENYPSAIRFNGSLYLSNRGDNSISCFEYKNGLLQLKSVTKTGGNWPRDFEFFGSRLICTNQQSDNITLFSVNGEISEQIGEWKVPSPICVVGRKIK
ncbi:MAG: beta-propeller fold lactonase family protein, partial [Monoglobales bacterium]